MTKSPFRALTALLTVTAALGLVSAAASGQQEVVAPTGVPSLRPYWHVFIAYALTIALIFGWVVSIARRLGSLERRLGE